jgi:hypothetical protein
MKVFWKPVIPYKKWRLYYVDSCGEHSTLTTIENSPYFELYIPDGEYTANIPNRVLKERLNLDPYEEVYDTRATGLKAKKLASKWKRRVKQEIEDNHISNWKTEYHFKDKFQFFWRNKINKGFVLIDKVEEGATGREFGKYIVEINTPENVDTKYFNNIKEAKKFAKNYMKKSN